MASATHSKSIAQRPIGLRMRGELEFSAQQFGEEVYWAIKDPVALKYYHLRDEEYTLLTMLDGQVSLGEVRERLEARFAPRRITEQAVHGFLATLHRLGLVVAQTAGQGEQLSVRQDEERRRRLRQSLLGVLAIRFRGVNPSRFLDWLYPQCRWLFSPFMLLVAACLALSAMALVTVQFDAVLARLPSFRTILSASNLPWLAVALAITKLLHELGHALACRHFGCDCHELGVIFLAFTPSLYCNVSDSWMLRDKWQRMAIAAAGIYVELLLAATATLLWWASQPGLFNALCLNVMIVCSVGTLLLNGNPLLRYDGYYILADLLEIPNLAAQSSAALRRWLARGLLGVDLPVDQRQPARRSVLLLTYAVLAGVYRGIVVVAVLWGLNELARRFQLQAFVLPLAVVTVVGMVWPLVAGVAHWLKQPAIKRRIAPTRAAFSILLLAAAAAGALWIPLPMRVTTPLVVEYRDAASVYITSPGTLSWSLPEGTLVERGQPLARLTNADVELELSRLATERNRLARRLENLQSQRLQGSIDGAEIPGAQAALEDAAQRYEQVELEATRLTLVAPQSGTVLAPPKSPAHTAADMKLDRWSGTPLEPRNAGCFLETGTLLCLVGDPDRVEAVLNVDENDIELVAAGQPVRLRLDHGRGAILSGKVVDVARLDLKVMPRELTAAGDVPSRTDDRGITRPLSTWYQARVEFDAPAPEPLARVHGQAKIEVAPQSLTTRVVRYLKQTFRRG